jgi:hypothetical protein
VGQGSCLGSSRFVNDLDDAVEQSGDRVGGDWGGLCSQLVWRPLEPCWRLGSQLAIDGRFACFSFAVVEKPVPEWGFGERGAIGLAKMFEGALEDESKHFIRFCDVFEDFGSICVCAVGDLNFCETPARSWFQVFPQQAKAFFGGFRLFESEEDGGLFTVAGKSFGRGTLLQHVRLQPQQGAAVLE